MGILKKWLSRSKAEPPQGSISLPPHITYALMAHAAERGITPEEVIADIVTQIMEAMMLKAAEANHACRERNDATLQ